MLSILVKEIRTSFDYFESQSASSVSKIFLSGAGAKFPELKGIFLNLLGVEADYWGPFKNISLANTVDAEKVKELSGQLVVAVGLALRDTDRHG